MPEQVRNLQSGPDGAHSGGDDPPRLLRSEHRTPAIVAAVALVVLVLAGLSVPLARVFGDQRTTPESGATPTTSGSPSSSPSSPTPSDSVGPPRSTPSGTPSDTPSTLPTPKPSGSPETEAPPYERTTYDGDGAVDNVLYNVYGRRGAGACGGIDVHDARNPLSGDALAAELDTLITCSLEGLTEPMDAADIELSRPELKVYDGETGSPCGVVRASEHPAYYCPANETIYFPGEVDSSGSAFTLARLGYLDLLAHEFGHHLQHRSGIYDDYTEWYYAADETEQLDLTRRSELQAQCFSSLFVGYLADDLGVSAEDLAQLEEMHTRMGDDQGAGRPPTHGSSAAQLRWMARGLGTEWSDYGRCNTWVASADEVR